MVEFYAERLQIEILFLSELAHRELAHRQAIAFRVVTLGELPDVLTVVAALGNLRRLSAQFFQSSFYARRQIVDLDAGVVVVEFTCHLPPRELEKRGNGVAQRCLSPVTDVKGTGRIRRDEFDVHHASGADGVASVLLVGGDDVAHARGKSAGVDPEIHEARTGDFNLRDPRAFQLHTGAQLLRNVARLGAQRLGEHHRQIGCPVSMRCFAWTFQQRLDILGRADSARRTNQLGADLISGGHSLFDFRLLAGVSPDLAAAGFASLPALASVGFVSGLAAGSVLPAVSPPPPPSAGGGVCGFLPSLP